MGCYGAPSDGAFGAPSGASSLRPATFDPAILRGDYRTSGAFVKVTPAAVPSRAVAGHFVDVWVSVDAAPFYRQLRADGSGSHEAVPEGATFIREVLDKNGTVTKITVMSKMAPGYNPDVGDFWWMAADRAGCALADESGPMEGRMPQCHSCHMARGASGFLFGVGATK